MGKMLIRRLGKNPLIREAAPLLGLYWLYSSIRWFIARDSPYEAFHNAFRIIDLERQLGIFHELAIQNWLIDHHLGFVQVANVFYTVGYFPVVIVCVVLLYKLAPHYYQIFKLTFLLGLGFALISFSVFPLAPPRMLPGVGFVDTQQTFSAGMYNHKFILSFYNPYAAMPSLHFGLALLVGIIAYRFRRRILKIAAVLYPSFMALVIVTTGHHYILDIIGGAIVMGMAYGMVKAFPKFVKETPTSPAALKRSVSFSRKHPQTELSLRSDDLAFLGWSRKEREYFRDQELRSAMLASLFNWRPPF
jgi:membrane-associated phospholipid phosphatase